MSKFLKQAFTLIELLVVIAIIGILSGLIIVSMSNATQKATIAKAQVFSNSLRNNLMLNLVSEWKLDQVNIPNANQTPDSWNGVNTGTLYGAGGSQNLPQLQTTNCVSDNCFYFDGNDDYINYGSNESLNFGWNNQFSLSAWVKTNQLSGAYKVIIRNSNGSNGYVLAVNGGLATIYLVGAWPLNMIKLEVQNSQVNNNAWHYLTATYDGSKSANGVKLYLDGINSGSIVQDTLTSDFKATQPFLMANGSNWGWYSGYIDEVRIYNATIPTSQIKEQYYAGLNKMLNNGNISKEEYISRINNLISKNEQSN